MSLFFIFLFISPQTSFHLSCKVCVWGECLPSSGNCQLLHTLDCIKDKNSTAERRHDYSSGTDGALTLAKLITSVAQTFVPTLTNNAIYCWIVSHSPAVDLWSHEAVQPIRSEPFDSDPKSCGQGRVAVLPN